MTKPRISKVFDMSKYISTKSGQELQDVLFYLAELVNDFIACLSNGLSYIDNFECEYKTVNLEDSVPTVIGTRANKRVSEIRVRQVIDDVVYVVKSFGWKYDPQGRVVVFIVYDGILPTDFYPPVTLIIYYS